MTLSNEKMYFRINGVDYTDFIGISCSKSMVEFSGGFTFNITDRKDSGKFFDGSEKCEIVIGSEIVSTGFIDEFSGNLDNGNHIINASGNEKTVDIIDSDLTSNIDFTGAIKLKDVIKKVLSTLNITDISVDSNIGVEAFTGDDLVNAEIGDNAFSFIEDYCKKRQVVITTTKKGNILLQRASTEFNGDVLQRIKGNTTNNVLTSSFRESFRNRYAQYICRCSDNLSTGEYDVGFEERKASSYDNQIRSTRKKEIIIDSSDIYTLRKRAIWEQNFRLNGGVYDCKVQGFRSPVTNEVWYPNMLVLVKDTTWKIDKMMVVRDVEWKQDGAGSFTKLSLVDPIAFSTLKDYTYDFKSGTIKRK